MRRLLAIGVATLGIAAACMPAVANADQPHRTPVSQVRVEGRTLVDGHGRALLLHGVNSVDKDAPYLTNPITAGEADLLARHGFNSVRLGVSFDALMPTRGQIDTAYLNRVASSVDLLGARGIYVLLDNHQDSLGSPWGGNGFPAWSIQARPAPDENNPGFPMNYLMPSMNKGWDEVWNNTHGVLDHLGTALAALAGKVNGKPAVLGIEVLNEPWPGSPYLSCFPLGCSDFDRKYQAALEKVTTYIRDANATVPVFWEPNVTWNQLMPSNLGRQPISDPNVAFSVHDYCIPSQLSIYSGLPGWVAALCPAQHDRTWANIEALQARTNRPALVTEFGDVDPDTLKATVSRADGRNIGWQYWHYNGGDPFQGEVGAQLVRTYPQATAGVPGKLRFNANGGDFEYTYQPRPSAQPTEIYVSDQHYPGGYVSEVTGGRVTSAAGARIVTVQADGTAPVTVRIHRPDSDGNDLPTSGSADAGSGESGSGGSGSLGTGSLGSGSLGS